MDVTGAILADPKLNDRQRAVLLDVYESFVGETAAARAPRTSMPTNSTRVAKAAKPRRTPSPAKEPRPAQTPIRAQMTPAQKTPAQKKTQQSSNKEKKS